MSLRKKFRDWKIRRLLNKYYYAWIDWQEWSLRFYVDSPQDDALKARELDKCMRDMEDTVVSLYWDYDFNSGVWYTVGDMKFYLRPSYDHVTEALDVVHDFD